MKLTAKQRRALPDSDFGIPETRQFPIHDKNHVKAALRFVKFAPPGKKKELIANINKRAKELGMNINIPAHEQVTPDIDNGMYVKSIEASNVGTLEPIVGASETIIPGGGTSYLGDEENPSFGAKVMDYVLRRKIVREDTVLEEGAVLSQIIIPDDGYTRNNINQMIENNREEDKEEEMRKYHHSVPIFNNFEKRISNIITKGQTRDMLKYITFSDSENKALNVAQSWQYISINAAETIIKILHDKDLDDKVAADRIYHLICSCPESDFIYLMATLYRGIYEWKHHIRFHWVASFIADNKIVFKGSLPWSNDPYDPKCFAIQSMKESEGFSAEEINKIKTYFTQDVFESVSRLSRIWNHDGVFILISDLNPTHEIQIRRLMDEATINGYLIIHGEYPPKVFNKSIIFVKSPYYGSDKIGLMIFGNNRGENFTKVFYFLNDDITKLAEIALRIDAKYGKRQLPDKVRESLEKMFQDVGCFSNIEQPNVPRSDPNIVHESVSSIFKDVKKMALAAMRRIHVEKDGEVSINLKDELTLANYSETHRLLQADLQSDDTEGLKLNIAYVFSLITIIETKYVFGKKTDKYSKEYKDAINLRGMLISDFNTGLNAIRKKDPSFSFIKFYKESGFESAVYKFNAKAITNLSSSKLVETIFQNILRFGR